MHGLATLALEEVGKAWLAHLSAAIDEAPRPVGHVGKLIAAREFAAMYSSFQREGHSRYGGVVLRGPCLAEDDFYTRMAGLYVDLIDGEIVGSPASITAD